MASLTVTNTLVNATPITAAAHNTNYADIVNYINNRNSGSATWDASSISTSSTVPLIVNNSTGANDIVRLQDNGTNVFVAYDGGIISMPLQSCARAYRGTSAQVVASANIQFNAESYDIQSEFDSSTNYRFTATQAGKYLILTTLNITPASDGYSTLAINSSAGPGSVGGAVYTKLASTTFSISASTVTTLAASQYITINLASSAGDDTVNFGEDLTYIAIHKLL